MSLFKELKRRNVFKVGIAYVVVAWLVLQVADVLLNNLQAPAWVFHVLLIFLVVGFPIAVLFAWAFELTPKGLRRESTADKEEALEYKDPGLIEIGVHPLITRLQTDPRWQPFLKKVGRSPEKSAEIDFNVALPG